MQLTEKKIATARHHAEIDQQVSTAPRRIAVTDEGRMFHEDAWKPTTGGMLPWHPPAGVPVAMVNHLGEVEYLTSLDPAIYPPEELTCCCCGNGAWGRQWWNRDTGYGLCKGCIETCSRNATPEDVESRYGISGIHYNLPDKTH